MKEREEKLKAVEVADLIKKMKHRECVFLGMGGSYVKTNACLSSKVLYASWIYKVHYPKNRDFLAGCGQILGEG